MRTLPLFLTFECPSCDEQVTVHGTAYEDEAPTGEAVENDCGHVRDVDWLERFSETEPRDAWAEAGDQAWDAEEDERFHMNR